MMIERPGPDRVIVDGFERRAWTGLHRCDDRSGNSQAGATNAQIVHDLRQPAAAISALASAVQARGGVNDDIRSVLATIAQEADRLSAMCGRLLEDTTELEPLCLDVLVEQIVDRADAVYMGQVTSTVEPCVILGDELGWWRLLGNVVDNATRAAGPGGSVTVALRRAGRSIELDVEDSGPGFGHVQTNLGLGLLTVFRIVDSYGGHVELGRSPLGGARLRIVVPAMHATALAEPV